MSIWHLDCHRVYYCSGCKYDKKAWHSTRFSTLSRWLGYCESALLGRKSCDSFSYQQYSQMDEWFILSSVPTPLSKMKFQQVALHFLLWGQLDSLEELFILVVLWFISFGLALTFVYVVDGELTSRTRDQIILKEFVLCCLYCSHLLQRETFYLIWTFILLSSSLAKMVYFLAISLNFFFSKIVLKAYYLMTCFLK